MVTVCMNCKRDYLESDDFCQHCGWPNKEKQFLLLTKERQAVEDQIRYIQIHYKNLLEKRLKSVPAIRSIKVTMEVTGTQQSFLVCKVERFSARKWKTFANWTQMILDSLGIDDLEDYDFEVEFATQNRTMFSVYFELPLEFLVNDTTEK